MTITTTIRKPSLTATLNAAPLSDIISARVQMGFNLRVAEAELVLRALPTDIMPFDEIEITMGGTVGTAAVRFNGYFISADNTLYPKQTKLICKGKLARAEWQINDVAIDMATYPGDPGHKDEVMVSTILYICKLSGDWIPSDTPMDGIEGTGQILGHTAGAFGFEWDRGDTALSFIEKLDAISLGYRTYDTFDGTIKRTQINAIPAASAAFTFTEGVDIYRATESTTIWDIKNKIKAYGYPGQDGKTEIDHTAEGGNPFLIYFETGEQLYHTQEIHSNMIEFELLTDKPAGYGISCEEVADWELDQLNVYSEKIVLTTPRDDVIDPGDTIAVVASIRLGITSRNLWVQEVDIEISNKGAFSQVLTCITGIPFGLIDESSNTLVTEADVEIVSE